MENGTTYIVRPCMQPLKMSASSSRISPGSRQLFVGPAASSFSEQMNVLSSTRATSPGSERERYEFGRLASERRSNVPASTSDWQSWSYSSAEPSHQCTDSGWVSSAISSTQASNLACFVGAAAVSVIAGVSVSCFAGRGSPIKGGGHSAGRRSAAPSHLLPEGAEG